MKILGFNISREKAMQPVNDWRHGWRVIHEPYTGAWQKNDELKRGDLTCYPALYACLNRITQDIGKLPFVLKREGENGIWKAAENPAWSPVLRKPNGYQTAQQFREAWILSKLIDGNVFVLKQRDNRDVVTKLYVLDPCRVETLVSEAGRVFYRLSYNNANNLLPENFGGEQITIPASEIIHDRINPFHHQLIGVPPLCAAALAAGKNIRILRNSSAFFENSANPGGVVAGPAGLRGLAHHKPCGLDALQGLAKLLELGAVPRNGAVTVYRHASSPDSRLNLARKGQVEPRGGMGRASAHRAVKRGTASSRFRPFFAIEGTTGQRSNNKLAWRAVLSAVPLIVLAAECREPWSLRWAKLSSIGLSMPCERKSRLHQRCIH